MFEHSRLIHTFQATKITFECIRKFNGENTNAKIAQLLEIDQSEVEALCAYLLGENLLQTERPKKLDYRYSRQLNFLSSFETSCVSRHDLQQKLVSARVVVVGLGAIGTWVTESLARCGLGALTLVDPDTVEICNLPRQGLYSEADVGSLKVDAAKRRLRDLNSEIKVKATNLFVDCPEVLIPHIEDASVVINCSDIPDVTITNDIISLACFPLRVPHLLCGGYDGHSSFVGQTVIPFETSCWRCYAESQIYDISLKGFRHVPITAGNLEGGTLAPISCITANIHALEAMKLITGYYEAGLINRKAELDFLGYGLTYTQIPRNPHCSLCAQ